MWGPRLKRMRSQRPFIFFRTQARNAEPFLPLHALAAGPIDLRRAIYFFRFGLFLQPRLPVVFLP